MNNIDLIPNDYREWLQQRRMLVSHAIAFVVVFALVVAAGAALSRATAGINAEIAQLRSDNAITQQQQQQLEVLRAQKAEYERQWSLLRGLRAAAALEDVFRIVDDSIIDEELWFIDWSFRRAGIIVDGEQRGIETGYFIIVPAEGQGVEDTRFVVETHMTIRGQARDHRALSRFVRALYRQELIADVSVRKTSQVDFADGKVVDFDITVVLNSAVGES